MKPHRRQYVGVAATTTPKDVAWLLKEVVQERYWPSDVLLMNGPLVSRRTLMGEPASNPAQYLPIDQLSSLILADPRLFNVIHFNSRDPQLCAQLLRLMELVPQTQGIQLNIAWPEPTELKRFLARHRHIYLILQVSRFAYQEVGGSPDVLVERLKPYEGLVDYVLFDPSGGEGIPFDRDQAIPILEAEVDSGLDFGWGVTGGLDAGSVEFRVAELLGVYPWLSWDAQSRMRSTDGRDRLILANCGSFLHASACVMSEHRRWSVRG